MTRDPREALVAWRASTGYSQAEVGALFGVSKQAVGNWEQGRARVPQRMRRMLKAEGFLAGAWAPWTAEHDAWLEAHRDTYSWPELAAQLTAAFGILRTLSGVRQHLQQQGRDTYTSSRLLTRNRVAMLCGVSNWTVSRWVGQGWLQIPAWARRGGGAPWTIPPPALEAFVNARAVHLNPHKMPPSPYRDIVAATWERNRWLDVIAAGQYAGVHARTVAAWCHDGLLPAVLQRRRHHVAWLIRARDLAAFLRRRAA